MKTKTQFILLMLCFIIYSVQAQNLVTNFDFSLKEPSTGCPMESGFSVANGHPAGWYTSPFKGYSPDYFHPCGSSEYQPGSNSRGCEHPLSGTAYVGVLAYLKLDVTSGSEYFYQQLSQPLTQGQQYYMEFWVSAADNTYYNAFVKHLGMYLTNDLNDLEQSGGQGSVNRGLHHLLPQIPRTFPSQNFYNKLNGWQKISGYFTPPSSGYQYIVIGNFDPGINNNTPAPTLQYRTQPGPNDDVAAFYYVDAVTIIPSNQTPPVREPNIVGTDLICTDNASYTLSNVPVGSTVTWQATPSNLFVTSSGSGNNPTLLLASNNTSGSAVITFTINSSCGSMTVQKNLWVGLSQSLYFTASYNQSQGIMLSTPYVGGGATAQWSVNGVQHAGFDIAVQPLCIDYTYQNLDITLTLSNQCDSKSVCTSYTLKCPPQPMLTNMGSCGGGGGGEEPEFHEESQYSVSPNPANRLLSISVVTSPDSRKTSESSIGESKSGTTIQSIALTDINGYFKYSCQYSNGPTKAEIDVSNLKKGVYILKISNGKHIETHRVILD